MAVSGYLMIRSKLATDSSGDVLLEHTKVDRIGSKHSEEHIVASVEYSHLKLIAEDMKGYPDIAGYVQPSRQRLWNVIRRVPHRHHRSTIIGFLEALDNVHQLIYVEVVAPAMTVGTVNCHPVIAVVAEVLDEAA